MNKFVVFFLLLLSGCSMIPKYCRPDVEIPCEWRIQPNEISCSSNSCWWKQFQDPILDELVIQALEYNQDIKAAIYRVEEYMAQLGISRSQLYPQIDANVSAINEKESRTLRVGGIPSNLPATEDVYTLVLNGSYYLDIWGLIRSSNEVALANLLSQIEVRKTVVMTVISAVATSYINLRQFDLQRFLALETLKTRFRSLELVLARYHLGYVSDIEVQQARVALATAQTDVQNLEISIGLEEDLLSILVGMPPTEIKRGDLLSELVIPPEVPMFLPSDLLNQRPDILAAEQNLIAANAQIGVARAQFFPQISLTGSYGTESSFLSQLLKNPSTIWQYGVSVLQEIFTGGRLTNQLRLAEAQKMRLIHRYQTAILNGFKEVNDALIAHSHTMTLLKEQKAAVDALKEIVRLANLLYVLGRTDYLNDLDAERRLFAAEQTYTQTLGQSFTTLISIYQALGGGWVVDADEFSTQAEYCQTCE